MPPTAIYSPARILEMLDAGTVMLHCYICDTDYPLPEEAALDLRKQLNSED